MTAAETGSFASAARDAEQDLFFQAAAAEDPNPIVHRMRAEDPVHFVPGLGVWVVTRHDDVKRLFNDPDNVTNDRRGWEHYQPREQDGSILAWIESNGLFALPPKEHARIRRLVSAAFTPRAVQRMDEQIRETVERFAAPLRDRPGEIIDFMAEFTNPIPNAVISRLTGVPAAGNDEERFRELAQKTIRGFFSFAPDRFKREADAAFVELADWVREMSVERRAHPQEDLISDLIRAAEQDDRLSDNEIITLVTGLIGAGSETTALGGMIAIRVLLQHPESLEALRADRSRIAGAVNEILRFGFGGAGGLPRYAVRDFTLRGKAIRKGQMLMLSFSGANRDPEVWDDPDRFDIDRDCRELTVFGNGPHYCLGANLARQEMGCMVNAMLDVLRPGSTLREDLIETEDMGMFKRPTNLPVEIGA